METLKECPACGCELNKKNSKKRPLLDLQKEWLDSRQNLMEWIEEEFMSYFECERILGLKYKIEDCEKAWYNFYIRVKEITHR